MTALYIFALCALLVIWFFLLLEYLNKENKTVWDTVVALVYTAISAAIFTLLFCIVTIDLYFTP